MTAVLQIRTSSGTIVIGRASALPPRGHDDRDRQDALHALFASPEAMRRVRSGWRTLEMGGRADQLSEYQLRGEIVRATASGRIVTLFAPRDSTPIDKPNQSPSEADIIKLTASLPILGSTPAAPVPDSIMGRILEAVWRSRRFVGPEILALIDQLLGPGFKIMLGTFLIGLIGAQIGGVTGVVVDGGLVAVAWVFAGIAGVTAVYDIVKATGMAAGAKSQRELDAAARLYGEALVLVGTVVLAYLLHRFRSKGGGTKPQEPAGEPPPEPKPASATPPPPPDPPAVPPPTKPPAAPKSPEITPEELQGKTRGQVREMAKDKGLKPVGDKSDPEYPRKWKDPVTNKQRLRLDRGHVDDTTGQPYDNENAAGDHVHGYDPDEKPIKMDGEKHFPTTGE